VLAGSLGRAEEIAAEFPCLTTEFAVAMIIRTRWWPYFFSIHTQTALCKKKNSRANSTAAA
jgi:hypothetical protein